MRTSAGSGATGQLVLRADSGFYGRKVLGPCRQQRVRFSVTARMNPDL
ncbi:MAG: hypothetical protein M0027_03975 [Candidatus Dormibacteraeota bacterium]|nr:hypothetical protein [Candidatus Dormibacteraeota bacterium]